MTLQELREQKLRLAEQADQILKKAGEEQRHDLTKEEDAQFDAIHADIDKITKQIQREERQDAVRASLSDSQGRRSDPNPTDRRETRQTGRPTAQDMDLALRGWLLSGAEDAADKVTDAHRNAAQKLGVNFASKHFKIRLAPHALRSISQPDQDAWQKRNEERAAMGVSSGSIGGYSVPDAPMRAVEIALLEFGGMRRASTVLRTDTGADLPIPTNNDTSNKGRRLAENTQVTETDLTVGQLVLQAYKYSSDIVLAAVEFLQDTSLDATGFIFGQLGTRIGRVQNDEFTTGTGSSQPNGIVTAATSSSVTASGQTSCTYDNLLDLIHSVDPAYREMGQFMLHDSALKMIKKVKVLQYSGDTVGAPLWVPGVNGLGDTILGYPYVINQSLATVATGTKSVLFGQLNKYIIRDSRDIVLVRLDERYADYGQVGFLAFARSDGDLLDAGTHPVKYMTQA